MLLPGVVERGVQTRIVRQVGQLEVEIHAVGDGLPE